MIEQTLGEGVVIRRVAIVLALALVVPPLDAQQIYKCADGKGGSTYQQTPCDDARATREVRTFTPEADSPNYYQDQVRQRQLQQAAAVGATSASPVRAPVPRSAASDGGLIRDPYAMPQTTADDPRWDGYFDRKERRRDELAQRAAERRADPASNIGQPVQVLDPYSGKIKHNQVKVAPNRVWDPETGEYYDVHP